MSVKIIPFAKAENGDWVGQFGRHKAVIYEMNGHTYWRGPSREVVLETDTTTYNYYVEDSHSGMAYSLPGAMAAAEKDCIAMLDTIPDGYRPAHAMDATQVEAEHAAWRICKLAAIEADRIAASNGWDLSMDVLPELKALAEQEGLFPFEVVKIETPRM